ncbi:response regulator [Methanogenium organophilum]|uniref:Response regulator n=1 Tax=Methanogenium organophilum TaxID=2199 RepID=A0A9X9S203_METOG|nr:response regulator [Methanogenium organophilum]WAI00379.1 response regulator [Methanogenium organophilum]
MKMGTILVCDDSLFQRRILTSIVKKNGHNPLEAENGHECLEMAKKYNPDLIFLDLLMPEYDGFAVLSDAKDQLSDIPIVVITADIQDITRNECMELGARAFLNKPVDHDKAKAVIQEILGKKG